tara:strand:- start:1138 stop:1347 length:210 start_codon:yes stop_codon:yes gene_type:complete
MQLRSGKIVNQVDREMFEAAETLISFHDKVEMELINKKIDKIFLTYKKCLNEVVRESLKKGINIKFEKL